MRDIDAGLLDIKRAQEERLEHDQSTDVARSTESGLPDEVRKYLGKIGKKGGQVSKRELSSEDARAMAAKRRKP